MNCTSCGTTLVDGARFCSNCGAAVDAGGGLPLVIRVLGVLVAVVLAGVLVATAVVPSSAESAAAEVVAGEWSCTLDYAETDENPPIATEWDVELHEDGRVDIEDDGGETAEGAWTFEDGRLTVDFGDADLGNPELASEALDVESSLDEITLRFAPTADDEDEGVGARTLSCERD